MYSIWDYKGSPPRLRPDAGVKYYRRWVRDCRQLPGYVSPSLSSFVLRRCRHCLFLSLTISAPLNLKALFLHLLKAPPPMPMASLLLPFFLLIFLLSPSSALSTFGFDVHHRFSDPVRRLPAFRDAHWPRKGTVDYYAALADHDLAIHGRRLSSLSGNDSLTFYDGNATVRISSLGFLHYAAVSLGAPNVTFLVALDTGSDLFWVPCDCKQCAPLDSASYGFKFELNVYSPNRSSTSKYVPCSSNLCEAQECPGAGSSCPYKVAYLSSGTSSTGVLVEDVIHLTAEDDNDQVIDARIVLGGSVGIALFCGQVQTGSFLEAAAPNGLFGLGMEKISVPSSLASGGLIADSFSMCFGGDGIGRIIFGDQGSIDQYETPFNLRQSHSTYNVSVTGLRVGKDLIDANFSTIVDTGTSFTYLADPAYTSLSKSVMIMLVGSFEVLICEALIPFVVEKCSSYQDDNQIPDVILTMKGGGQFSVFDPIIVISGQDTNIYCLAVMKSVSLNIIGRYDAEGSKTSSVQPRNSTGHPAAPPIAVGPNSYDPEITQTGKDHQNLPIPPLINKSPGLSSCFRQTSLILSLFIFAVILL
ncbi:hypothetical protein ACLOJK_016596 [Asimina triloba]